MVTTHEIENKIFRFAYGAGLKDATDQQAYKVQEKGQKIKLRENDEAVRIVQAYVDGIMRGSSVDFYKTAKELTDCFNEFEKREMAANPIFSFGNAQKLINITVKFMYIALYGNPALHQRFQVCHCPLDRTMGGRIKKKLKDLQKSKKVPQELQKIVNGTNWKGWDGTWSRIGEDSYKEYQAAVKYFAAQEGLSPIEYDYFYFG